MISFVGYKMCSGNDIKYNVLERFRGKAIKSYKTILNLFLVVSLLLRILTYFGRF